MNKIDRTLAGVHTHTHTSNLKNKRNDINKSSKITM